MAVFCFHAKSRKISTLSCFSCQLAKLVKRGKKIRTASCQLLCIMKCRGPIASQLAGPQWNVTNEWAIIWVMTSFWKAYHNLWFIWITILFIIIWKVTFQRLEYTYLLLDSRKTEIAAGSFISPFSLVCTENFCETNK